MMPIMKASVNHDVQSEIQRAVEMHGFIQKTMPTDNIKLETDAKLLFASLFSLVMEHHGAILYLLRAGQFDGSAFALVCPLIECAYRAHWIYACAKPDIVLRIKNGEDVYPPLINMAEEIEKKLDTDGMFQSITPYIRSLHGYTHGGLEQLGRRFDKAGNVSPNYSNDEKLEVIGITTGYFTALAIAWCQLVSNDPPDKEPRSKAISEFYVAKYPLPGTDAA